MTVVTGLQTAIDGFPSVSRWVFNLVEESPSLVSTATQGGMSFVCGVLDAEGQIVCNGHTPVYYPGDTLTFKGVIEPGYGLQGPCIVENVAVVADILNNRPFQLVYSLGGNGAFAFGSVTASDTADPPVYCPAGMKVYFKVEGNRTEIENVTGWRLVLARPPLPYVSTATSGARKRIPGAWTAMVEVDLMLQRPEPIALQSIGELTLEVEADTPTNKSWVLSSVKLNAIKRYGVDLEEIANNLRVPTHILQFMFLSDSGTITNPDGNTVFPES